MVQGGSVVKSKLPVGGPLGCSVDAPVLPADHRASRPLGHYQPGGPALCDRKCNLGSLFRKSTGAKFSKLGWHAITDHLHLHTSRSRELSMLRLPESGSGEE